MHLWSSAKIVAASLLAASSASATTDREIAAASAANDSLLWGTYRPQLYHGLRPRLPRSLMSGLMWFGLNDFKGYNEIRHTCEDSDGLTSYTYNQHDGRSYATQTLVDGKNNVEIKTSWLKNEDGDEWALRVEGDALDHGKLSRTSLIYHFGLEGLGSLELESSGADDGIEGEVILVGSTPALGDFRIAIVDHANTVSDVKGAHQEKFQNTIGKTPFLGTRLPDGAVWRIKDLISQAITTTAQQTMSRFDPTSPPDPTYLFRLQSRVQQGSNVYAFQKTAVGTGISGGGKWGFDVYFEKRSGSKAWDYASLTAQLEQKAQTYNDRFATTFRLPAQYSSPDHIAFAQAITSNLIGGIGYFYGSSLVDRSFRHSHDEDGEDDDEDEEEVPIGVTQEPDRELLTATPSRSFFPRGFYWDEGFHLAVVAEWDNDLSLEVLKSWINLIDENGWVAREQILGEESRSKASATIATADVPPEFQVQYPSYANPPTLPVVVTSFIARLKAQTDASLLESQLGLGENQLIIDESDHSQQLASAYLRDPALAHSYLTSVYPALRRHYHWFRRTQRGQLKEWGRRATSRVEAYRWRGRTEDHVLTSGLDDYPRAKPPHPGELHLDLMSWMGYFARTMAEVAEYLGEEEDLEDYRRHEKGIVANLDDLHWNEEEQMYCDASVNEEDESIHVCHRGYLSLFPFLLKLVPADSQHIGPILDLISDPAHLWSPYGLRSLSASHPLFGQGENYWRGPIWIQMNWMALGALHSKYMREEGPHQAKAKEVYEALRKNVIENVFKEYQRTGYVWEQYDASTGEGRRSHPFTGWTSLVTLIMTEKY